MMAAYERKDLAKPDEVREFPKGRLELVNAGGGVVGRLVLEPGWRWSEHVKPIAGTEWCEAPHFQGAPPRAAPSRRPPLPPRLGLGGERTRLGRALEVLDPHVRRVVWCGCC